MSFQALFFSTPASLADEATLLINPEAAAFALESAESRNSQLPKKFETTRLHSGTYHPDLFDKPE